MFVKYNVNAVLPYDTIVYEYLSTQYTTLDLAMAAGGDESTITVINLNDGLFHIKMLAQDNIPANYLIGFIEEVERASFETWKTNNPTQDISEVTNLKDYKEYVILVGDKVLIPFDSLDKKVNYAEKLLCRKKLKANVQDDADFIADNTKLIQMIFSILNTVLDTTQKAAVGTIFDNHDFFNIDNSSRKVELFNRFVNANTIVDNYKIKLI